MCSLDVVNAQAYLGREEQIRLRASGVTEISEPVDYVIAARRSPCSLQATRRLQLHTSLAIRVSHIIHSTAIQMVRSGLQQDVINMYRQ